VVLIGDGSLGKARDIFVIPGRQQPVPGIYLHACAIYTLAMAPLYELTLLGRIVIDVSLLLLILLAITFIRPRKVNSARLEDLLTLLVVVGVILGGMFVRSTCLMWNDFILTLGGLLLHPRLQDFFWHMLEKAPQVLVALLCEPHRKQGKEGHQ